MTDAAYLVTFSRSCQPGEVTYYFHHLESARQFSSWLRRTYKLRGLSILCVETQTCFLA